MVPDSTTNMTGLPDPKDVRDMLADLLDRDIQVAYTDPLAPSPIHRALWGVYVNARLELAAVAITDFEFGARAGAAIGLIPPGGAAAAIEDGELSDTVKANVHEILNISAALLNSDETQHVKLHDSYGPDSAVPSDVVAVGAYPGRRLDLEVDIHGYGSGRFSLVLA